MEPDQEITQWLSSLHLAQYASSLTRAGYRCLKDLKSLTEEKLVKIDNIPTGHRRRILSSLENLMIVADGSSVKVPKRRKPIPRPRQVFSKDGQRGTPCPHPPRKTMENLQMERQNLSESKGTTRGHGQSSSSSSASANSSNESLENSSEETNSFWEEPNEANVGFQGEMVENEIYEECPSDIRAGLEPRSTRSYRLRHRPVPDIPEHTFLPPYDWKERTSKEKLNNNKQEPSKHYIEDDDDYSTVLPFPVTKESANESSSKQPSNHLTSPGQPVPRQTEGNDNDIYSVLMDDLPGVVAPSIQKDVSISPYACFYGAPKTAVKGGWLDKLSPQGNCVFQRRWVKLEGGNLTYRNSDKEMYSKGLIPISAIKQVRALGENKFEVITSVRTFLFRAEKEGERHDWLEVLQSAVSSQSSISQQPHNGNTNKSGYVELRGLKGRIYLSLMRTSFRISKTDQDFNAGLAISVVDLTAASVKHVERKGFEITTPFKSFCFTAESEREREEWIEAIQESIVESLSNYEVLEKVWFNKSNRKCADCQASEPEWASINLCVVICKNCTGLHRFLGPGISKVRSMKLDSSIWSNELIELFLEVGNKNSNRFWAANLPPEEKLCKQPSPEQRASFIRKKYKERKYKKVLEGLNTQEELNKALCAAVLLPDVLQTMTLVFTGADVMCATGDPEYSTPYLLAQKAGQRLQMEFLHHNKLSDFPKLDAVYDSSSSADVPSFMDGFLFCSVNSGKSTLDRRGRPDIVRRWCTLEGGFLSYYDNEKIATPIGRFDISEVVSLAINHTENITETGPVFTFELYLQSHRVLVFGAESSDAHREWTYAIAKCFVPSRADALLRQDSELIGRLYYKEGHDLYHWRTGWFALVGSELYLCSGDEDEEDGVIQLKRLQELTASTHIEGDEKIQVLLMVESGRTVYIHGITKLDFALWHTAIQLAARTDGTALSNQQMNKNDVPIIVDSCIAFVTQYGLCCEGIYQKNGDPGRVAQLQEVFTKDARIVKLRLQDHQLEDVTDTLKSFLSHSEDALLAKELYPFWISTLDEEDEMARVQKYKFYIQSLPKVNRSTLDALLQHLYRVQRCSLMNQMSTQKLACVFSPCLFQTEGRTPQETRVVEDLINNYIHLFSFSPAGDLIFEVYLEKKEPEKCCLIKVSPSMRSDELAVNTLEMKGLLLRAQDLWTTFEVIENGELERPLHYKEKILEQVLEWSSLEDPSSAYLLIKKYSECKMTDSNSDKLKDFIKGEQLKFKDGSSKLLYFCCKGNDSQQDWVLSIIRVKHGGDLWPKDLKQSASLPYNLSRRTSTDSIPQTKHNREVKGKSVLSTSIETPTTQKQLITNRYYQPDSTFAGILDSQCESRMEMVMVDGLKSKHGASPQQDHGALPQLSQKKAVAASRGAQLPQNIINELSTVLNKTGRCPKEND
ncbi:Arf-GAP with [Triplophysa tibetana]|uniref:Arf-GAP with n=1 Tax=Triplophysa tibetana TaxID=1572043 RepID=A0A5A9PRH5_9TELE|nr:Arf-GAP with [Triplophysa tibetana]